MAKRNYAPEYGEDEAVWLWGDNILSKAQLREILSDKEWEEFFNCQCKQCRKKSKL